MSLAKILSTQSVVVFGRAGCKFCDKTKALFTEQGIGFGFFDAEADAEAGTAFGEITAQYKHDTYPAVFINKKFIGGNSDVQAIHAEGEGKLKALVEQK